jgi:tRNA threonylcarbamoyladenosine biosynthesis protein TsaB
MAYILNIESSTNICSVCISNDEQMLSIRETFANEHASAITILIEKCLEEAALKMTDLSAVAISNGPGSYTSLRVGGSTAKGICYALNIPLIAIDTLEALALAAYQKHQDTSAFYCPMIDARRMEVYAAIYKIAGEKMVLYEPSAPLIIAPETFKRFTDVGKRLILSGNGAAKCEPYLMPERVIDASILCSAAHMIPLSKPYYDFKNFVDVAYHTPQYLKAANITVAKNKL